MEVCVVLAARTRHRVVRDRDREGSKEASAAGRQARAIAGGGAWPGWAQDARADGSAGVTGGIHPHVPQAVQAALAGRGNGCWLDTIAPKAARRTATMGKV